MRSQLMMALVVGVMATAACTKKDNKDQGYAGVGPGTNGQPGAEYGEEDYGWSDRNQLPAGFQIQKLDVRGQKQVLLTVRAYPDDLRGNLEKIRIQCADSARQAIQSETDGLIMIDGSELAIIGDFGRRVQNTLVVCNDGNFRDDKRQNGRRFGRNRFEHSGTRLQVGQNRTVTVRTASRNLRQERVSVIITCAGSPVDSVTQNNNGITLLRGSTVIVSNDGRQSFGGRGNQPPWNNRRGSDTTISCE